MQTALGQAMRGHVLGSLPLTTGDMRFGFDTGLAHGVDHTFLTGRPLPMTPMSGGPPLGVN